MTSTKSEFIWGGRVHLGDELGIYGDSQFCGLLIEYPITIKTLTLPQTEQVNIILTAENVNIYPPYKDIKFQFIEYFCNVYWFTGNRNFVKNIMV
ncbi:MAG: hypothetical protein JST15_04940 [Bacteroidetes bacterium]|nr:hypothetical protein [Bacteroidota bacterium]